MQRDDVSVANLVASGLFADGAAAVVARGVERDTPLTESTGPRVLATRSRLYPDSERTMGWDVRSTGLRIVLDAEVPNLIERHVRGDVDGFLADQGLTRADIDWWVCHPGGPKVIEAIESALELPRSAVQLTWDSLARIGNLSSVSVLQIFEDTLRDRPPAPGSKGILMAMGPGLLPGDGAAGGRGVTSLTAFTVLVLLVGLERLAELVVSNRNAAWSLERGGVEYGRGHYPFMVVLHSGLPRRHAGGGVGGPARRVRRAGLVDARPGAASRRRCAGGASPPWDRAGTPG